MRDPARIERILRKLEKFWKDNPDLRLGQLVSNISSRLELDIFSMEDDRVEKHLDALCFQAGAPSELQEIVERLFERDEELATSVEQRIGSMNALFNKRLTYIEEKIKEVLERLGKPMGPDFGPNVSPLPDPETLNHMGGKKFRVTVPDDLQEEKLPRDTKAWDLGDSRDQAYSMFDPNRPDKQA